MFDTTIVMPLAVAAATIYFLARWLMRASNRIVAMDERCNVTFADIDAHLKHRHNLIPPLVETVRGFANHERELVLAVTGAGGNLNGQLTTHYALHGDPVRAKQRDILARPTYSSRDSSRPAAPASAARFLL